MLSGAPAHPCRRPLLGQGGLWREGTGDMSPSPQNNTWVLETKRKEKGGTWVGNAEKVKWGALSKPPWDSPDTAQLWGDRAELGDTPYSHPGPLRKGQWPPRCFPSTALAIHRAPRAAPSAQKPEAFHTSPLDRHTQTLIPARPCPCCPRPSPVEGSGTGSSTSAARKMREKSAEMSRL